MGNVRCVLESLITPTLVPTYNAEILRQNTPTIEQSVGFIPFNCDYLVNCYANLSVTGNQAEKPNFSWIMVLQKNYRVAVEHLDGPVRLRIRESLSLVTCSRQKQLAFPTCIVVKLASTGRLYSHPSCQEQNPDKIPQDFGFGSHYLKANYVNSCKGVK